MATQQERRETRRQSETVMAEARREAVEDVTKALLDEANAIRIEWKTGRRSSAFDLDDVCDMLRRIAQRLERGGVI